MSKLYEDCCRLYEKAGQSGVFDYINNNHPEIPWAYCEPCEIDSPVEDSTCLVCGSIQNKGKVVIEVEGGIAYLVKCPPDVEVVINDLD